MPVDSFSNRKTFAIISHPDAGKTTITEKLLLHGSVLQQAGTVKARGGGGYAKSDWMEMEKSRGISVTTSVMQFPYKNAVVNLLDTPGHEDFSEDTYRTLTAVDSCLMVIDAAKGVEDRTKKLMEVTRLRDTPIITFINKLDRDTLEPMQLIDDVETELGIVCLPMSWPIGCGKSFKGVYHILNDEVVLYQTGKGAVIQEVRTIKGDDKEAIIAAVGEDLFENLMEDLQLVQDLADEFSEEDFLAGKITPVFFGTALGNFGVDHVLDGLVKWAPEPLPRTAVERQVLPSEAEFSGFVFKIQANMDPKHRDRIAFMRIVSGSYQKGMKLKHVRVGKSVVVSDALTFMSGDRNITAAAVAGDIIGLHNHGTIRIGDTFTQNEVLKFTGVPSFAPLLFRRIILKDPFKQKHLIKGLLQLSEEGAVQTFKPLVNNDLLVGAVGMLQFDVVVSRLNTEYKVDAKYESTSIATVRWVTSDNAVILEEFKKKYQQNLALDASDYLTYVAPSFVNLSIVSDKYPEIRFSETREL